MRLSPYSRGTSADLQLWDCDRIVEPSANAVAFVEGQVGICKTAAGEASEVAGTIISAQFVTYNIAFSFHPSQLCFYKFDARSELRDATRHPQVLGPRAGGSILTGL